MTEAGVPLVTVYSSAGDLNGGQGDHWDTHGDNFNRIKNKLAPPLDRASSALLDDLADRGTLDETLVVWLTEFGRTPRMTRQRPRSLPAMLFGRLRRRRHSRRAGLRPIGLDRGRPARFPVRTRRSACDNFPRPRYQVRRDAR